MNVQPHYDRVACLFNDPNAVHGGEVYVTKVDCGLQVPDEPFLASAGLSCLVV